jgi:hypothetical protein
MTHKCQSQRLKFHTAELGSEETIEDFAQRIRDLGSGHPEAADDAMMLQRFRKGLKTTLKIQSLAISAGFDEVVSRASQMSEAQSEKQLTEWARKVSEGEPFRNSATATLESLSNPVGPDPDRPNDVRVWNRARK